jgi:hypothetical protein
LGVVIETRHPGYPHGFWSHLCCPEYARRKGAKKTMTDASTTGRKLKKKPLGGPWLRFDGRSRKRVEFDCGKEMREKLRRGEIVGYHILNRCELPGLESDFFVVSFRELFVLPKNYIFSQLASHPEGEAIAALQKAMAAG